jgi:hypothetical protein
VLTFVSMSEDPSSGRSWRTNLIAAGDAHRFLPPDHNGRTRLQMMMRIGQGSRSDRSSTLWTTFSMSAAN